MAHVEIDAYYIEEQDEPTVRRRIGLDAPRAPRGRAGRHGSRLGASGGPVVRPAVVIGLPGHDNRLPLVA